MTEVTSNAAPASAASGNGTERNEAPVQNYTDGYSYEVPRPFLTFTQAAQLLGMTLRSLERSVMGKWGNKLPDGWAARKMKTQAGDEWRILPPPGFRVKMNAAPSATDGDTTYESELMEEQPLPPPAEPARVAEQQPRPASDPLSYYNKRRQQNQNWRPERHTLDTPTIVIDRTEEVEHLLRELLSAKSALAEERRLHMEDLRMITQMQGSMRLLEVNAADQARTRQELDSAKQELNDWKEKYNQLMSRPWWRRLFGKQ